MIRWGGEIPERITEGEEEQMFQNWKEEYRARLIEGNIRLALYVANKYEGKIEQEELMSCALFGLVKAGNAFEPSKMVKFSTYAVICIENEILMHIRREKKHKENVYLSNPVKGNADEKITYEDVVSYEDRNLDKVEEFCLLKEILQIIEALPEPQRTIVMGFCCGEKQIDTARKIGVSQPQVSRLFKKAIAQVQREFKSRSAN